jgi:hypothetical protein
MEREQLQEEQLARENERRAALGLEPIASTEELDTTQRTDVLLNQATRVVADMAAMAIPPTKEVILGTETAMTR